tara:strand:+ start:17658 stop:18170 length:513 start_codon:yes stop_codon:yes gene_type:complete
MNYVKKMVTTILFIISFVCAQSKWFAGNMKDLKEMSISINLEGLDDELWKKKIVNFIELSFAKTEIGVDQKLPMPKLVIAINAINKPRDKVSSYMINYAVYDHGISESEYFRTIGDSVITRKLMTYKVYEREVIGQSNKQKIYLDIEKVIMKQTSLFIDQWYRDNPLSQF